MRLTQLFKHRRQFDGRQDDVGYVYICFEVDDLDAVYQRMSAAGYDFHSEPQLGEEGQIEGSKFCVMRDPDGKTIEFIETGPGMKHAALHEAAKGGVSLNDPLILAG